MEGMTRRVTVAAAIWGASILLSRIIGLVREAVIGRTLGGGAEADVFWASFVVPDFLNYLLAGGALTLVCIPIFARYLDASDTDGLWRAFWSIATPVTLVAGGGVAALWWLMPELAAAVAPGFTPAQQDELVGLTRIVLPAQIFHLVGALFSALLQAQDRHRVPAMAPLLYTGGIVAGGLIGGRAAGPWGFAWGALAGSAAGPFALQILACVRSGPAPWSGVPMRWRPRLALRDADLRAYAIGVVPIMIGWSIAVVDDWLHKRFGSRLGESAVATLQYGKTLMRVPMGVFGLAFGLALYPTVSRLVARGARAEAWETLSSACRRMLVLALGAQAVLTAAGPEISRVVYGARIGPEQHAEIGLVLGLLCVGLWAWSSWNLFARGFYAQGNTWLPVLVGTLICVPAYPLYAWAASRWGTAGIAGASTLAITIFAAILAELCRRSFGGRSGGAVSYAARMVVAVAGGVAVGLTVRSGLDGAPAWLRGACAGAGAGLAYGAIAFALRVEEVRQVARLLGERLSRRR